MGQQQLLLIVLGVIVVGIAIVVGINLFNASAVSANRDAVISDLNNLAALSMSYYKKPTSMGGGGNSFTGFAIPADLDTTANGVYTIATAGSGTGITFKGVGTETGDVAGTDGGKVSYNAAVNTSGQVTITKNN